MIQLQPSAEELAQYAEAVAAGIDPETARQEMWPIRKPEVMYSLVRPEGHVNAFLVGWTTCGTCLYHVKQCTCSRGPSVPEYILRWHPTPPPVSAVSTPVETTPADGRRLRGQSFVEGDVVLDA